MLDNQDLQTIKQMMDEQRDDILQQAARNTQVIIENVVDKKFNLVLEALEMQTEQIKQLASKSRVEELEDEMRLMKSVIRSQSDRITALERKFA